MLQHLLRDGAAVITGHHCFSNGNWAELITCDDYTFHRPCPPVEGVVPELRNEIEANPKGNKEPRIKDARHTLEEFLKDKPMLTVYEWPGPCRSFDFDTDERYESCREEDVRNFIEAEGLELVPPGCDAAS